MFSRCFHPKFFCNFYLFLYFWLCWIFTAFSSCSEQGLLFIGVLGLLIAVLSLSWQSTGSRHVGSIVVVYGLSCLTAHGIFPDQGSNQCPLHCKVDSLPLDHHRGLRGSFVCLFLMFIYLAAPGLSLDMETLGCSMWGPGPWLGMVPGPPALWAQSLSHWTTREVPAHLFLVNTLWSLSLGSYFTDEKYESV